MAMVHGIVKNYGGTIRFESSPEKGSTFFVYLPLMDKAKQPANSTEPDEPSVKGKGRILLVDDETAICRSQTTVLESLGYTVTATSDSREALDLFNLTPGQFDMVLTDFNMPDMDGVIFLKKLQHEGLSHVPVVIITGLSKESIAVHAFRSGVQDFFNPYIFLFNRLTF